MFKRALVILVILNALGLAIYSVARHRAQDSAATAAEKDRLNVETNGEKAQRNGVMPKAEYVKYVTISEATEKTGAISDEDFKYLIDQTKDPHTSSSSPGRVHEWSAMPFTSITKYTPAQKEEIMQAVIPLIRSSLPLDQRIGLDVVAHLRDARAVPDALPLLQSSDPHVQRDVQKYLTAVGYSKVK